MCTAPPTLWSYCTFLRSLCPTLPPVAKIYAELRWSTSRFTSRSINHTLGCTQGSGPCADGACHVVRQLSTWNEFLIFLNMDLREGPPGQLSLLPIHGTYGSSSSTARQRHATILVHWLLTVHRCVTRFELDDTIIPMFDMYFQLYCDALTRSVGVWYLKVSAWSSSHEVARFLVNSIVSMRRLKEFVCKALDLSTSDFEKVLESNAALKKVSVAYATECSLQPHQYSVASVTGARGTGATGYEERGVRRIAPILHAIGQDSSLDEITLDFCCFESCEQISLIYALSLNTTLRKVNVGKLDLSSAKSLCDAIRRTTTTDRVRFDLVYLIEKDLTCIKASCPEVTKASLLSIGDHGTRTRRECLTALTTCTHLTVLNLNISTTVRKSEARFLYVFLEKSHNLREFYMSFAFTKPCALQYVLQGLSKNKCVEKLGIEKMHLDEESAAILAKTVGDSETIWHFDYENNSKISCRVLLTNLARCLFSNTCLLSLNVSECTKVTRYAAAAKNFVRRNVGLTECAAHFVLGTRNKHCAEAFESVASSTRVVARVQELAGEACVDRAKDMIREASRWLLGMTSFMKITGVVKNELSWEKSVECRERLEILPVDCWLHVRQFIKVRHVLDRVPDTSTRRVQRANSCAPPSKRLR
ncbi:hypothetical protein HPB50_013772 [Hyalomma asiaticum]|uniref:Uncharacterized protein n=1 Tax=Hyalomma asiaticum TaxID=266040 RepID=A0ACB7TNT8_HYAAI|nr:hypothetical protein HPB50_013772 [Hyalomma asiaticum]